VRGGTSTRKRSSGVGLWVSYIVKLSLAVGLCGAAYWLIFTGNGQLFVEKVQKTLGMAKKEREETPALKVMKAKKCAKLDEKIADMSWEIKEETLSPAHIKQIIFSKRDGADYFTVTFQVNLQAQTVRGQDGTATGWLK
jgi:hypothetical protein